MGYNRRRIRGLVSRLIRGRHLEDSLTAFSRLQVNAISTGLLAVLLLPTMQRTHSLPSPVVASALKPHLVIVSSDGALILGVVACIDQLLSPLLCELPRTYRPQANQRSQRSSKVPQS